MIVRRRIVVCAVLAVTAVARAQEPSQAMQLFEDGRALMTTGDWDAACQKFEQSLELDRASGTALNLASCEEKRGHLGRAYELFVEAGELAMKEKDRESRVKEAHERAQSLQPRLATVIVRLADPAGADVKIGSRSVAPAREIKQLVDPGAIEVTVAVPDKPTYTQTRVVGAGAIVVFDTTVAVPTTIDRTRVHIAMGLGAGAVVSLLTSFGFGIVAKESYNSTITNSMLCSMTNGLHCTQHGVDRIAHARMLSNIGTGFGIVAAALGIAGGIVWLTAPEVIVSPAPMRDGAGFSIVGRF